MLRRRRQRSRRRCGWRPMPATCPPRSWALAAGQAGGYSARGRRAAAARSRPLRPDGAPGRGPAPRLLRRCAGRARTSSLLSIPRKPTSVSRTPAARHATQSVAPSPPATMQSRTAPPRRLHHTPTSLAPSRSLLAVPSGGAQGRGRSQRTARRRSRGWPPASQPAASAAAQPRGRR